MPSKISALILALVLSAAPPLAAAEMTGRQAGKVIKEAKTAEGKGDLVKARELYQLVAASTAKAPEQRAAALYQLVLLEAGQPAADRQGETLSTSAKTFLADFPKHEGRGVIAALASLLGESEAHAARVVALEAQIAADAEAQKELASTGASAVAKKVDELESKLRRASAEVEVLKAELSKKDEALKKLKQVVVGGSG
jgi:hypothetical protein